MVRAVPYKGGQPRVWPALSAAILAPLLAALAGVLVFFATRKLGVVSREWTFVLALLAAEAVLALLVVGAAFLSPVRLR